MVHDPNTGKRIKSFLTGLKDARSLLILSNDQIAVGFKDGSIKIFDLDGVETHHNMADYLRQPVSKISFFESFKKILSSK